MKRTKAELLEAFKNYAGERDDDETIGLMEDISDSYEEGDGIDWKAKYEENDRMHRKKYMERFLQGGEPPGSMDNPGNQESMPEQQEEVDDVTREESVTIDDLFTPKEGES